MVPSRYALRCTCDTTWTLRWHIAQATTLSPTYGWRQPEASVISPPKGRGDKSFRGGVLRSPSTSMGPLVGAVYVREARFGDVREG